MSYSRTGVSSKLSSKYGASSKYSAAEASSVDSDTSDDEDIDIHEIVRTGTLSEVKDAISKDRPRFIALKDKVGRTVLHYAAQLDRSKVALYILSKNANVNAKDKEEQSPLHLAASNGHTDMCRFLLDFNAAINVRDLACWNALHHAVWGNHMDTSVLLIKRGVDLNVEDLKSRTPLHLACERGYAELAECLVIRGANLYGSGDYYYAHTPLHTSCLHRHIDCIRVLLKRGADVEARGGLRDESPLFICCELGWGEGVAVLVEEGGANVDAMGVRMNGHSPLHIACEKSHLHIVEQLLRLRADPLIQGKFRCNGTPLHTAARVGNKILVSFLLDWGVDVNIRDRNNNSILHLTCQLGHYDLARYLIEERRADFQARNLKDIVPLDLIPVKDALVKDKLLLLCARMKAIYDKEEALRIARIERDKMQAKEREERERQIEREKHLQLQTQRQRTEEFRARMSTLCCHARDAVALTDLLQQSVDQDVNMPLDALTKRTALHMCAYDNNLELVELLLRCASLDVNAQDALGNTALHYAAQNNNRDMVEMLLGWEGGKEMWGAGGATDVARSSNTSNPSITKTNNLILNLTGLLALNLTTDQNIKEIIRNPSLIYRKTHIRHKIMQRYAGEEGAGGGGGVRLPPLSPARNLPSTPSFTPATGPRGREIEMSLVPYGASPPTPPNPLHTLYPPPPVHFPHPLLPYSHSPLMPEIASISPPPDFFALASSLAPILAQMKKEEVDAGLRLLGEGKVGDIIRGGEAARGSNNNGGEARWLRVQTGEGVTRLGGGGISPLPPAPDPFLHQQVHYLPDAFDTSEEFEGVFELLLLCAWPYIAGEDGVIPAPSSLTQDFFPYLSTLGVCMGYAQYLWAGVGGLSLLSPFFKQIRQGPPNLAFMDYEKYYYDALYILTTSPTLPPSNLMHSASSPSVPLPPLTKGDLERIVLVSTLAFVYLTAFLSLFDPVYIHYLMQGVGAGSPVAVGGGLDAVYANTQKIRALVSQMLVQIQYLEQAGMISPHLSRLLMQLSVYTHYEHISTPKAEGDDIHVPTLSPLLSNPPRAFRNLLSLLYLTSLALTHELVSAAVARDLLRAQVWRGQIKSRKGHENVMSATPMLTYPSAEQTNPLSPFTPSMLQISEQSVCLWLTQIHLHVFFSKFLDLGFRDLADFQSLGEEDVYRFFPFLAIGERRRLVKACSELTTYGINIYKDQANSVLRGNKDGAAKVPEIE